MKIVREHINEKFIEDSDPIHDLGIGVLYEITLYVTERFYNKEFKKFLKKNYIKVKPGKDEELNRKDWYRFIGTKDSLEKLRKEYFVYLKPLENIRNFKKLNEKFDKAEWKPLEGIFGATVDNTEIEGKVSDLIKFIKNNHFPVEEFDVKNLYKTAGWHEMKNVTVNGKKYKDLSKEEKADFDEENKGAIMNANLKYPIIVTKNDKGKIDVLDGNHRVEKAYILKRDKIKGIVVPKEDIIKNFKKK